jgi:hypothetical protein
MVLQVGFAPWLFIPLVQFHMVGVKSILSSQQAGSLFSFLTSALYFWISERYVLVYKITDSNSFHLLIVSQFLLAK